jgi:hypothetical protein
MSDTQVISFILSEKLSFHSYVVFVNFSKLSISKYLIAHLLFLAFFISLNLTQDFFIKYQAESEKSLKFGLKIISSVETCSSLGNFAVIFISLFQFFIIFFVL